jgi:antitoxin ParD1/3/4
MAKQHSIKISLTPELNAYVKSKVDSGAYENATEIVRDGLRQLAERDREDFRSFSEFKREIAAGLEQAKKGQFVSGADAFREARARLRSMRKNGNRKDL